MDTLATLSRSSSVLLKSLGREPTAAELAEDTGIPLDKVEAALRAAPDLVSLSAAVGDEGDHELGDVLADQSGEAPFDAAAAAIERDDLWSLLAQLDEREREILSLRFGLADDRPLTLDEVGRRFNLTRERIRQIEAKALTKLRHPCSAHHRKLVDALGR
jgi:RNA polymerase primary sigma factor